MEQYLLDTLYITGCAIQNKKAHIRENMDVERTLRESYGQSCSLMILYGLISAENNDILEHCADMKEYLEEKTAQEKKRYLKINKMIRKLEENGFDPIVIKGPVLADLYPMSQLREFTDIDLFFDNDKKRDAATEYLLAHGGKSPEINDEGKHNSVSLPGIGRIELHRSLYGEEFHRLHLNEENFISEPFEKIVLRSGDQITTLGKTDAMKYIFCHMVGHFLFNRCDLKQVCDVLLYLKKYKTEIDEAEFLRFLNATGNMPVFETVVGVGIEYLGFNKEDLVSVDYSLETVDLFVEDCFNGCLMGVWGKSPVARGTGTFSVKLHGDIKGFLNKLHRGFFPGIKFLTKLYPYCAKNPLLLPIAWGNNIIDLAKGVASTNAMIKDRDDLLKKLNII